jgi:predicted amidohydrolase
MTESATPMVRADGTYATTALRQEAITATVAQTRVLGVDGANPAPDLRRNLDYFLECIDIAQGFGGRSDLLLFHEFPITGFSEWTREQHYRLALEVPGPETELVAQRAKKYNCYIIFGTYAKDEKNWPGHILHLMVMAKPDGSIVTHWKQRNVRGMFPGGEQYTSVIYDVYDRFVEMYGIDAVIPVERTDIGNIAMSAVQFEPELFRCMAFKGAELICRVATGGFEFDDMRLTSYHNSLYTLIANNCVNTGERNRAFLTTRPTAGRAARRSSRRAAWNSARPAPSRPRSRRGFRSASSASGTGSPTCTCSCTGLCSTSTRSATHRVAISTIFRRTNAMPSAISRNARAGPITGSRASDHRTQQIDAHQRAHPRAADPRWRAAVCPGRARQRFPAANQ